MPYEDDRSDVTRLIELVGQGDPQAARDLLPVLYDELRRLAAQRLSYALGDESHRSLLRDR
jgi:hypothetical protein